MSMNNEPGAFPVPSEYALELEGMAIRIAAGLVQTVRKPPRRKNWRNAPEYERGMRRRPLPATIFGRPVVNR